MKAGLLGGRLSHSLSPVIHGAFSRLTGIPVGYELFETQSGSIEALLDSLQQQGYAGVNVTIPYKTEVIKYLDGLSGEASLIGAVNTVHFKDGKKLGFNTDYYGLKSLIESSGINIEGCCAVILGTGGAARCALQLMRDMRAANITSVSRRPEEADGIFNAVSYDRLGSISGIDVLINTTPVGMAPDTDGCPVSIDVIRKCACVIDLIYNPAETRLLKTAREFGGKAVNGLPMLCTQAVKAQEIWNGCEFSPEIYSGVNEYMQKAAYRTNIVLIGMPGSGKTTVGKLLAKEKGMEFTDTDAMVEEAHGSIPEIFRREGEAAFRKYEREAALKAASKQHTVISTGGGIIQDEGVMRALKQTGTIVFLDRPLQTLLVETDTSGRPLLAGGKDSITELYNRRLPLYRAYSDIICENAAGARQCAGDIIKKLEGMQ